MQHSHGKIRNYINNHTIELVLLLTASTCKINGKMSSFEGFALSSYFAQHKPSVTVLFTWRE